MDLQKIVTNESNSYQAYFFIFDSSDKVSFEKLKKIITIVLENEKAKKRGDNRPSFETRKIIIGNKADLKMENKIISSEDKK